MAYKVISIFKDDGKTQAKIVKVDQIKEDYSYVRSFYDEYHNFFETYAEALKFKKECLAESAG